MQHFCVLLRLLAHIACEDLQHGPRQEQVPIQAASSKLQGTKIQTPFIINTQKVLKCTIYNVKTYK